MEASGITDRLLPLLRRYRYGVVILLVGLALMLVPGKEEHLPEAAAGIPAAADLEEELEQILSAIEGAGRVEVLLTEKTGPQTHYQTNSRRDGDESGNSEQQDTVIVEDAQRIQHGLVRYRDPPRYLGALIVCRGADSPRVRLALSRAVQCVTGLRADQIQVVKMK